MSFTIKLAARRSSAAVLISSWLRRRHVVHACVLLALSICGSLPAIAAFPDRPIKWIVPAAAGGAADATVRVVADHLSRRLGQPIVIDNRPGASGAIGLDAIAKSAADGYTIGTANITNIVMNRQLRGNFPFDPDRDLVPVARLTFQPSVLVVNSLFPAKNVKEFVDYVKANPGKFSYASTGQGSSSHIATEALKQATGMSILHIPYKSAPAANTDLVANVIQLTIDNLSTIAPHVKSGKVRALAVTSPKRAPQLPEVPTIVEAGGPDFTMLVWAGVVAPRGVPAEVMKRLSDELLTVLQLPDVKARLLDLGYDPAPQGQAAFAEFIKSENQRWGSVIKKAGIKVE